MFKYLAAAAGITMATMVPVQAQPILTGNDVEEIVSIARGYGAARLERQSNGDPKITARFESVTYQVFFMNCTANANCEDLNFYAGFLDSPQSVEAMNAWNRDRRFGKAYLDDALDPAIEFDVNLEHGVTRENLNAAFEVWTLVLDQYTSFIGYK